MYLTEIFLGEKLCRHQDSNPQPSNLLLLCCSCTFNTGLGLLLVLILNFKQVVLVDRLFWSTLFIVQVATQGPFVSQLGYYRSCRFS